MTLYTSLNEWIPQPGRITRSWPSGLVLLQQDFIGNLDTLGPVAVPGAPFPADDAGTSAQVYGLPEYRDLGNGLQSATVSAYGLAPGSGVPKVESLGAIEIIGGLTFSCQYYVNNNGELEFLEREFSIVSETATVVRCGTGELQLITSSPIQLKAYFGGQNVNGRTFTASEIFGFGEGEATVTVTTLGGRRTFEYYGDIWEQRTVFRAVTPAVFFGVINQPPPPPSS
jgi:hypothetical protein